MRGDRRRPPVPGPLGRLAERAYRFEIDRRNRRYDAGRGVTRLDLPIISIGNLSVGGTGKTPMVAWTVRRLRESGHRPCIAMRGYRKQAGGESDEEAEYRRHLPDTPVVAQPDRAGGIEGLRARTGSHPFDVVVLDDGFQHRRLARDLDIVLIDASRAPLAERLLPAGWLREPVDALRRAEAVVLTHTELVDSDATEAIESCLRGRFDGLPIARAAHRWRDLLVVDDDVERREPVSWLAGKRAAIVCAIGHPEAFLSACRAALGGAPVDAIVLPDHAAYTDRRLTRVGDLASRAELIVTTEKDWSKLRETSGDRWPCPIARPQLDLELTVGGEHLRRLIRDAAESPAPWKSPARRASTG